MMSLDSVEVQVHKSDAQQTLHMTTLHQVGAQSIPKGQEKYLCIEPAGCSH